MKLIFCSVTTLPTKHRKRIHKDMCYNMGGMDYAIRHRFRNHRLALLTLRDKIISWGSLIIGNYGKAPKYCVWVWTDKNHRKRGYAKLCIKSLLDKYLISKTVCMGVFSKVTAKIVRGLGGRPVMQYWDPPAVMKWSRRD